MEFLKNHYEKVILGVVLLALAVVAAWLPIQISEENRKLEDALVVTKREPAPQFRSHIECPSLVISRREPGAL